MPHPNMKVGAAADLIAGTYGDFSAAFLARQFRHALAMGALSPHGRIGEGRTAAAELTEADLCKLRLLSVLTHIGLSGELLVSAGRCMDNVAKPLRPNKVELVGMPRIVAGIRKGEHWLFQFHVQQTGDRMGGFVPAGADGEAPAVPKLLRSNNLATVTLPASDILRPLLDAAEG